MIPYLIIILTATVVIAVPNTLLRPGGEPWYMYLIMTVAAVAASFLIDAIVALIGRRCVPQKWLDPNKKFFCPDKKRLQFYEKLGVKKWKDKVPELGGFTDFHKNKLSDPWTNEYVEKYMIEACYGVVIHFFSPFFGFLIILLDYKMYTGWSWMWLTIMLPVALVNAVLIYAPTIILKYHIPKLKMLYDINLQNKKRREAQEKGE